MQYQSERLGAMIESLMALIAHQPKRKTAGNEFFEIFSKGDRIILT
jgi:hypothetical protein